MLFINAIVSSASRTFVFSFCMSPMQAKHRRLTDGKVQVAGALLDGSLQEFVDQNCAHAMSVPGLRAAPQVPASRWPLLPGEGQDHEATLTTMIHFRGTATSHLVSVANFRGTQGP